MIQKPIKIIVTGAKGQLGSTLRHWENNSSFKIYFTDLPDLDLTDSEAVDHFMGFINPDFVINCAAYTAVDKAETENENAKKINIDAVSYIAKACKKSAAILFHLSTDFVFSGNTSSPLKEDDKTDPVNFYGFTKLEGEFRALNNCPDTFIIRTSWLYSPYGQNFLKTMMRLSKERNEISVVSDQFGTPTYAYDLAETIMNIILKLNSGSHDVNNLKGIYHYSNEGNISWYDFAYSIFKLTNSKNLLIPILTKNYPTPARRPAYSVLDKSKIKKNFGILIPQWQESLGKCISNMK